MGYGRYSADTYDSISSSYHGKSAGAIFSNPHISPDMDPKGIIMRESRDQDENTPSLAVIIALDVTGSMGYIPESLVKGCMKNLIPTIMKHGVENPQVLFAGIGDLLFDSAPLQVGQFESTAELMDKWLTSLYLEGGGGGNHQESYPLAHLVGGYHTSIDCFEKRNQKGILITIGDEAPGQDIPASFLKNYLGYKQGFDISAADVLARAQSLYHVYHLHIQEGSYRNDATVIGSWKKLLGENLALVEDHTKISEIIATITAIHNGHDLKEVTKNFDKDTAKVVEKALVHVNTSLIGKIKGILHI